MKPDWQRLGTNIRIAVVAIILGAGIGFIFWLASSSRGPLWPELAVSALVGACIYLVAHLLLRLSRPWIDRLSGVRSRVVLAALFFISGVCGWWLAVLLVPVLSVGHWRFGVSGWGFVLGFDGGLGVVLGLSLYSYEVLRNRLASSIERIHQQEVAERELETARAIQKRLLPPMPVEGPGYRLAARNLPARYVAGDFYDLCPGEEGAVGLVVADVAGKGMGASLVMASVKTMVSFVAPGRSPAEVLTELNRNLAAELGPRDFVALCFVRYHPSTGDFELANAGLPDPYLLAPGGSPRSPRALPVPGPRLPLGMRSGLAYESLAGRLELGERLLVLSDGLPEALTAEGEPLGYERLEDLLDLAEESPERWLDLLVERIEALTGEPRQDDWTALVLERVPDRVPEGTA
jgi:hypothetical protein